MAHGKLPTASQADSLLHSPAEVSRLTKQTLEYLEQTKDFGVKTNIECLDKVLTPLRPGELIGVLALSSNFKTGFMQYVTRKLAQGLDKTGNECAVYVTWETAVEECGLMDIASATGLDAAQLARGEIKDWNAVKKAALKRGALPVYVIGHSLERRKKRPHMGLTTVALALQRLEEVYGMKPKLIALDYLQRMERDGEETEPRLQFSRNVDRAKDMALALACPVMLGCQAKQDVMERAWKLPRMNDGMETSNFMHSPDKILSFWRPRVTEGLNGTLDKTNWQVTDDLLVCGIAKQRFGAVGDYWPLSVDFARNEIRGQMEFNHIDLRNV
jgi:replicative DNA helicase